MYACSLRNASGRQLRESPGSPVPSRRTPAGPLASGRGVAHALSLDACGASCVRARDCPCHLAGRSLRASCPPVARRKPRFAILAALGFLRRSIGTGNPSQSIAGRSRGPMVRGIRSPCQTACSGQDALRYSKDSSERTLREKKRARTRPPGGAAAGRRPGKAARARDGLAAVKQDGGFGPRSRRQPAAAFSSARCWAVFTRRSQFFSTYSGGPPIWATTWATSSVGTISMASQGQTFRS